MNQSSKKLFVKALSVLLLCVSLTGCSIAESIPPWIREWIPFYQEPKTDLIAIIQPTRYNSKVDSSNLTDQIQNIALYGGNVISIVADGSTSTQHYFEFEALSTSIPLSRREKKAEADARNVANLFTEIRATRAEVNILSALLEASYYFEESDSDSKKLVIYSNGIQTVGEFSFLDASILNGDFDYFINQLKNNHSLPNLRGVDIEWVYTRPVGDQKTSSDFEYKIKDFWTLVIKASGGRVHFKTSKSKTEYDSDYEVSLVPVTASLLDVKENESIPEAISIDEKSVAFIPDSADLKDEKKAIEALTPIAKRYVSTKEAFYIYGMTARVDDSDPQRVAELSFLRADAIRNIMVNRLYVPTEQITVYGLGESDCSLRSANEEDNRVVWIVNQSSSINDQFAWG